MSLQQIHLGRLRALGMRSLATFHQQASQQADLSHQITMQGYQDMSDAATGAGRQIRGTVSSYLQHTSRRTPS